MKNIIGLALLGSVLFSTTVSAHVPVARCELQQENTVKCLARYDDNSTATSVLMNVYSYDNDVLLSGKSDRKGEFSFSLPEQPFYLLMDDGPGHGFEVDWQDIDGIDQGLFDSRYLNELQQ